MSFMYGSNKPKHFGYCMSCYGDCFLDDSYQLVKLFDKTEYPENNNNYVCNHTVRQSGNKSSGNIELINTLKEGEEILGLILCQGGIEENGHLKGINELK